MKTDHPPVGCFLAVWITAFLIGFGIWGVIIWAIISLVNWLTA